VDLQGHDLLNDAPVYEKLVEGAFQEVPKGYRVITLMMHAGTVEKCPDSWEPTTRVRWLCLRRKQEPSSEFMEKRHLKGLSLMSVTSSP
jgi:hypothetical protein